MHLNLKWFYVQIVKSETQSGWDTPQMYFLDQIDIF